MNKEIPVHNNQKYLKTFEIVSHFKGKLTDHKDSPIKRFGISQRSYPNLDIIKFTELEARVLYYYNYWLPAKTQEIPYPLCLIYFETAIDAGKKRAIKILQMALNNLYNADLNIDGELSGLVFTLLKKHKNDKDEMIKLVAEYLFLKLNFYYRLSSSKPEFEKCVLGWAKKVYKFWRLCFSEITEETQCPF